MAGKKYLSIDSAGMRAEVAANDVSAGAADATKIVALDSAGRIDNSMMPVGIGADTKSIIASEALAAGDMVNVWLNAAASNVRKADASATSAGKTVDGFVLTAVSAAASAIVYFEGTNNQLTGLTIGAKYFLSGSAPGGVTLTPPVTAGHSLQYVGKALSATELSFEPGEAMIRA